jgi:hypothetical protein
MRIREWIRDLRMADPALGSLRLTACGPVPGPARTWRLAGVVTAPGAAPARVEVECTVPPGQRLRPGQQVPVRVDRASPGRLVVLWRYLADGESHSPPGGGPARQVTVTGDISSLPPPVQAAVNAIAQSFQQTARGAGPGGGYPAGTATPPQRGVPDP